MTTNANPLAGQPSPTNPVLDEIHNHINQMSPEARAAIAPVYRGADMPGSIPQQPMQQAPTAVMRAPSAAGPAPMRGTLEGDKAALQAEAGKKPGLENVYGKITGSSFGQNHPVAGKILGVLGQIPSTIADTALSAVAPRIGAMVPGTTEQHGLKVQNLQGQIGKEQEGGLKEAQTREQNSLPELHQSQLDLKGEQQAHQNDLNEAKLNEKRQHDEAQLAEHYRQIGYKINDKGEPEAMKYEELPPKEQAIYDLKNSQTEAEKGIADYKAAQKANMPQAMELARQRIAGAAQARQIAMGRLGLSEKEFQANYYGTDMGGNALPGAPATAQGAPEGIKVANLTKPGATAQGKAAQGQGIVESATHLKKEIDKYKDLTGNMESYWKQAINGTPISDPRAAKLMSEIQSFAALQPALHGFRSHDAMKEFSKMIGGIPKNAEALKASIDGLVESAAIPQIHAGTMRTVDQGKPAQQAQGTPAFKVRLQDAMNLPQNKGKSEADVRADVKAHGGEVQ
jgi:hypothetical protein